jgi:hypothetical protein
MKADYTGSNLKFKTLALKLNVILMETQLFNS